MIKNKLESLKGSKFANSKISGISGGSGSSGVPLGIPIGGSGTINGSAYSYSGDISTCTGTGTISSTVGHGPTSFSTSLTKEFMYDCDWSATVTYDGYTKSFHGYP
ncbi:MAG: hypothetical protein JNJ58_08780 [Chitinophagaceae bacterium]|nr:hypothetical protein [Chitinophagaceae bacterium]